MARKVLSSLLEILLIVVLVVVFVEVLQAARSRDASPAASSSGIGSYPAPDLTEPARPAAPQPNGPPNGYPVPTEGKPTETSPTIPPPTAPPITADGWHLYSNPKIGFSFSYPPNVYNASTGDTGASIEFSIKGATTYQGMDVTVNSNPDKLGTEDYLYRYFQNTTIGMTPAPPPNLLTKSQVISVGGISSIQTKIPSVCSDFTIFVPHGDNIITIALVRGGCVGQDSNSETLDLFNKILNTFTFTKPGGK